MNSDLAAAIEFLLTKPWEFFTETIVPGTDISIAAMFIGLILMVFGLRLLGWALKSNDNVGDVRSDARDARASFRRMRR